MADDTSRADLRRWAATWREAGKALAGVKRRELRALRTTEALAQLADAFDAALSRAPRTSTSGLITQQEVFSRLRPR